MQHSHVHVVKTYFDENGFLTTFNEWNETIAQEIAFYEGLGKLSEEHYEVLKHLREHYTQTGSITPLRVICHESHLGPYCINELFSSHGVDAWKIAGLPDPGEEVKSYM
jgi:tRNA 2-thiouridine synthesizing protein E